VSVLKVVCLSLLLNRNKINIPDPTDEDQTEEESVFLETTQSAEIDGPSSEPYTSQPELDEVKETDVTEFVFFIPCYYLY
jgi:hypothetical protein